MSITERKQREKEEMRNLILNAAREIFLQKGYHETSIRNIAEKIDYSPGTIYLYFKEKDEIFHELHEDGFMKFLEKLQPLEFVADPFERLKAMGKYYMEFAKNNKDLYDLMFITQAPMNIVENQEKWEMGCRAFGGLQAVISECQERGRFVGKDLDYLSFIIWSAMHGMCALYCRGRMHVIENKEPDELLDKGYQYFIEMLEKL